MKKDNNKEKRKGCKCGCNGNNRYCDTHYYSEECVKYSGTDISPTLDSILRNQELNNKELSAKPIFSPTPTDSWVEIDEITETVNNTKYVEAKLAKEILSQVRQKAKEEVLRDIIVMETPTRGIEGETVMEYASSLGIDLSSNK